METTALVLAYVGVALMVGLAGVASSIGTAITGQAAVGAMKKNGGAFGSYMILSALPGSQGLYGFVCFFLVQKGLTDPTMVQGAAIFGAGLLVGLVNIAASIYQAKVCANGIAAIGNGHDVMGRETFMLPVTWKENQPIILPEGDVITYTADRFPRAVRHPDGGRHLPDRNARRRESLLTGRNARHRKGRPCGASLFRCRPAVGALSEYEGTVVVGHHDNRSFGGYGYYSRTGARSVTTVLCGATRCAPSGLCRGALPYGAPRPRAAAIRSLTGVSAGRRASRGCVPGCPASCGCPSSGR